MGYGVLDNYLDDFLKHLKAKYDSLNIAPGRDLTIDCRFSFDRPGWISTNMTFKMYKNGKIKCKINKLITNPGGVIYFPIKSWMKTSLQNQIVEYICQTQQKEN